MTIAEKTKWCVERGIPRWMALAFWDEAYQVWHLVQVQYSGVSPAARKAALKYELQKLRREIWDQPRGCPSRPSILRPSKMAKYNGYRHEGGERKRQARLRVDPEYRREIATLGAIARIKEVS